jgi:hypothetical protein
MSQTVATSYSNLPGAITFRLVVAEARNRLQNIKSEHIGSICEAVRINHDEADAFPVADRLSHKIQIPTQVYF